MKRCAILTLTVLAIGPASADPVELADFRDLLRPPPTLQLTYGITSSARPT
jgi:hypothetical protein